MMIELNKEKLKENYQLILKKYIEHNKEKLSIDKLNKEIKELQREYKESKEHDFVYINDDKRFLFWSIIKGFLNIESFERQNKNYLLNNDITRIKNNNKIKEDIKTINTIDKRIIKKELSITEKEERNKRRKTNRIKKTI